MIILLVKTQSKFNKFYWGFLTGCLLGCIIAVLGFLIGAYLAGVFDPTHLQFILPNGSISIEERN